MSFSFRFVCQGGALEYKAAVLAASLKAQLFCTYELIACVPSNAALMQPSPRTLEFLESLGCHIQSIINPIAPDYLIGHKFDCLKIPTNLSYKVFLDSDILCTNSFVGFPIYHQPTILAKLEDWNHHSQDEWSTLYDYFDLGVPNFRYRSTVLNEPMPLYFNAGVLCIQSGSSLVEKWLTIALDIENNLDIPRKRPNLDQLSLSITLSREEYDFQLLDERSNYPAELRSYDPIDMPYFCHYHNPAMVLASKYLTDLCRRIASLYPTLTQIIKSQNNPDWKYIFEVH